MRQLPEGQLESEDVWVSSNNVRYCAHCGALLSDPFSEPGEYGPLDGDGCDVCDPPDADDVVSAWEGGNMA